MNKKIFGIIFPLFFILMATRSIEQIKWVSYSAPFFLLYFLLIGYKDLKNKELWIPLLIIASFSLWAMITSFWSPYPRETFVRSFVFLVSSGGIITAGFYWAKNFSKNELGFLIPLNILLLIASVFSLMAQLPADYWAGYGFGLKSFWAHQNTLASLIIFTIPGIFFLPLKDKKIRIIVALILFALNVYILILTHSRTSLAVLFISVFLFPILTKRYTLLGVVIIIFAFISVFYFGNKGFHSAFHNYLFKTETSLLDRKKSTISETYQAAGHGGWKGLGFGVSDTTVVEKSQLNLIYHFEGPRLVREKTVSIYALIERNRLGWTDPVSFFCRLFALFSCFDLFEKNRMGICFDGMCVGWYVCACSV